MMMLYGEYIFGEDEVCAERVTYSVRIYPAFSLQFLFRLFSSSNLVTHCPHEVSLVNPYRDALLISALQSPKG